MTPVTLTALIESNDRSKWITAAELIEMGEVPPGRVDEVRRKYPNFAELLDVRQRAREETAKNH